MFLRIDYTPAFPIFLVVLRLKLSAVGPHTSGLTELNFDYDNGVHVIKLKLATT